MLVEATLPVPASLMTLLAGLAPLFTAPSFRTFCGLACGFLAQPRKRTVCGMLAGAGLARCWSHDRAHRFFSRARWSPDELGLAVAKLVVALLVPAGEPVTVAIDDTLFRRRGKKVWAASWFHDGSAPGPAKTGYGNNWVVAAVVVKLPAVSLYSGTLVTSGSGAGITVATGAQTELGEIHRLVGTAEPPATPLTRKLARFSKVLTAVILALAAVTFVIGLARGESASDMFIAAVALAVGAIPEGLPAAVTITLAIGVGRMARRRAVIRRLPAVETLGSTTVICSDKTGTLTQNQMTVRAVQTPDGRYDVTGTGYLPDGAIITAAGQPASLTADEVLRWCLLAGAGCNDAALDVRDGQPVLTGDPTEAALLVSAGEGPGRTRPASPSRFLARA